MYNSKEFLTSNVLLYVKKSPVVRFVTTFIVISSESSTSPSSASSTSTVVSENLKLFISCYKTDGISDKLYGKREISYNNKKNCKMKKKNDTYRSAQIFERVYISKFLESFITDYVKA